MTPVANKDIAYCINEKCNRREKCFRNIENYWYDKDGNYWFSDFTQECIKKGYIK